MALGTPFDRLELGVLCVVAAVFAVAQPVLTPNNPGIRMVYLLATGLASLGAAALVHTVRGRASGPA
jgi:hypothetical protein